MEECPWAERGLGGPGRSEELGGSVVHQLLEPDASPRLGRGAGRAQEGAVRPGGSPLQICTWVAHPSRGPPTPLVTPLPWRGDRDTGSPSTDWTHTRPPPRAPAPGIAWKVQAGTTSRWCRGHRTATTHRKKGSEQRPAGGRAPVSPSQKSQPFPEPETQAPGVGGGGYASDTGQKGPRPTASRKAPTAGASMAGSPETVPGRARGVLTCPRRP